MPTWMKNTTLWQHIRTHGDMFFCLLWVHQQFDTFHRQSADFLDTAESTSSSYFVSSCFCLSNENTVVPKKNCLGTWAQEPRNLIFETSNATTALVAQSIWNWILSWIPRIPNMYWQLSAVADQRDLASGHDKTGWLSFYNNKYVTSKRLPESKYQMLTIRSIIKHHQPHTPGTSISK